MNRWAYALKLGLIDDIAAIDDSEARAMLLDRDRLRTLIQHGWYPPANTSLMQLYIWADGLRESDDERVESARQIGFKVFREDAQKIRQTLIAQFPHRGSILQEAFDAHWARDTTRRFFCFSRRQTGSAMMRSARAFSAGEPSTKLTIWLIMFKRASFGSCLRG
ncbi:MAG: hypothetical protein OXC98_05285 [bacterium]|nr:hypothetical protein [Acidimicrobiia bacterium]MCY4649763.1 hypothetical protein [bacterium]